MNCCQRGGQSLLEYLKAPPWVLSAQLLDPRAMVEGHADEAWGCLKAGRSCSGQGEELREPEQS